MYNVDEIREERTRLAAVIAEAKGAEEKIAALDQVLAVYDKRPEPPPSTVAARAPSRTSKRRPRVSSSRPATYPCPDPNCDRMFTSGQGANLHASRAHRD